jgi:hypothetical protein
MPKPIQFNLNGSTVSVELEKKIYKEDLYGKISTLAEKDGRPLVKGYLEPDGEVLLRSQISSAKVDPLGSLVEDPAYMRGQEVLTPEESSFEAIRDIAPAELADLATFACTDVYGLSNVTLDPGIYRTSFSYRKGHHDWPDAFVVVRADGAYLLGGTRHALSWMSKAASYSFFDTAEDGEEDADLLDFSAL